MKGRDSVKKFICIAITFALTAALFACTKKEEMPETSANSTVTEPVSDASPTLPISSETEQILCSVPTINRQEEKTAPVYVIPEGLSDSQQIHWPNIPVLGTEPFQVAACAEMSKNPKFNGAKIIKDQYLQLGEINGETCVRVHLDTDKGNFVAVMNEACEILWVWTEGEEKTVEYYFPQSINVNVATDEALMQAFHVYHADEHYKNGIICNASMAVGDCADGSAIYKVTFVATTGDFSVVLAEDGTVISRTK